MRKLFLVISLLLICGCSNQSSEEEVVEPQEEIKQDIEISVVGFGDNLIHGAIYHSNYIGDNKYDFSSSFKPMEKYINDADLAYINQETPIGGVELGLSHYPMFNGPKEVATSLAQSGFDWTSFASNHTLDKGEQGIINTHKYLEEEGLIVTGSATTQEESEEIAIFEKEGFKIALLSYTYGTNGIAVPEGKDYLVNLIDKDKISSDIAKAKKVSDAIVVSMHWGDEYQFEVSEYQKEIAQFLADEGVSAIIGSHPHVIQPCDIITAKDGREVLVAYSLGNIISAQDDTENMLGGMISFTLVKDGETNEVTFKDAKFYPTVTHYESNYKNFSAYLLKDYTEDLALKHTINRNSGAGTFTKSKIEELALSVMNDKIEVVIE